MFSSPYVQSLYPIFTCLPLKNDTKVNAPQTLHYYQPLPIVTLFLLKYVQVNGSFLRMLDKTNLHDYNLT